MAERRHIIQTFVVLSATNTFAFLGVTGLFLWLAPGLLCEAHYLFFAIMGVGALVGLAAWNKLKYPPHDQRISPLHRNVVIFASTIPAVLALIVLLVLTHQTASLKMISAVLYTSFLGTGTTVWNLGKKRRDPDAQFCKECGYQKVAGVSPRCPECGTDWNDLRNLAAGRKDFRMQSIGIAFGLIGALALTSSMSIGRLYPLLPDSTLITLATYNTDSYDLWKEIENRNLSGRHTIDLLEHCLDHRLQSGRFDWREDDFVQDNVGDPTLPQHLIDRYYRESFSLQIHAPRPTAKWQKTDICLTIERARLVTADVGYLFFGGYLLGNSDTPVHRLDQPIRLRSRPRHSRDDPSLEHATSFKKLLTPDTAVPIKANAWLVIFPARQTSLTIEWNPDGTPVIPPNAIWHGRVELETTIQPAPK